MKPVNLRVQKHRETLRQAGFRPVQLWVPDTRRADFAQECMRQSLRVMQADQVQSQALDAWLDDAALDADGWTA